ncbi:receptor-type tyrosine-protein phosphatase epsilon-like isoform X2 [Pomacea canaliculata]|uniref:receptor-type tyrosine-protein phosphatase epsilon-like isoform X2 n=1 Tax=Pomacea canaliculata TaxID=400727 RepID=UPI000D738578|nr:receptor-type tyrosine-protein phosphatase epsilon-like isoform X2 [Pomacea canaliculata]
MATRLAVLLGLMVVLTAGKNASVTNAMLTIQNKTVLNGSASLAADNDSKTCFTPYSDENGTWCVWLQDSLQPPHFCLTLGGASVATIGACALTQDNHDVKNGTSQWEVSLGESVNIRRVEVTSTNFQKENIVNYQLRVLTNTSVENCVGNFTAPTTNIVMETSQQTSHLCLVIYDNAQPSDLYQVRVFGNCLEGYSGRVRQCPCRCNDTREMCQNRTDVCPQLNCQKCCPESDSNCSDRVYDVTTGLSNIITTKLHKAKNHAKDKFIGPLLAACILVLTICCLVTVVWKRSRGNVREAFQRMRSLPSRIRSTKLLSSMMEVHLDDRESALCAPSLPGYAPETSKTEALDGATGGRRTVPAPHSNSTPSIDALDTLSVTNNEHNECVISQDLLPSTAVHLQDLPTRVSQWRRQPQALKEERAKLPTGQLAEWKIALLARNVQKSRYRDLYPYDHSRVLLNVLPGDPHSDFYNANYIHGYNKKKEFIAAQGPTEKTLHDFLRMVWDTKCQSIIMLTKTVENGKFKCAQYWPSEDALSAGRLTIRVKRVTSMADFCIRDLIFEQGSQCRKVKMFHFTTWPDNSTPTSPWSLLDFRHKVRQEAHTDTPTIVHCSAGIGRTGTYLALDILLSQSLHDDTVDVFKCVWNLRQQRTSMVQTQAQYNFIYEVLAAAAMTSVPVPAEKFNLSAVLREENGTVAVRQEFQNMNTCLEMLGLTVHGESEVSTATEHVTDTSKRYHVAVYSVDGEYSTICTDALCLSSYRRENAFIQARTPTEDSAVDFLSIVCQHHVKLVVCLDTFWEQIHGAVYTPEAEGMSLTFDPYRVQLLRVRADDWMTTRILRIYLPMKLDNSEQQTECSDPEKETYRDVIQLSCFDWPESFLAPEAASMLLPMVKAVRSHPQSPALVHCRDGHSRSGIFCILSAILERLQMDNEVGVSYVTARMRVPCPQNIINVEQYEFLYRCVEHHISFQDQDDTMYSQPTAREKSWAIKSRDSVYVNSHVSEGFLCSEDDTHIYGNVSIWPQ